MSEAGRSEALRNLPSVRAVLEWPEIAALVERSSRQAVVEAIRLALDEARARVRQGDPAPLAPDDVHRAFAATFSTGLKPVINATGIVLHTNLGRAPLAQAAVDALATSAGYCSLEILLDTGLRGGRLDAVEDHLRAITGAEAGYAVNNGAAAALLALSSVAAAFREAGKDGPPEVIVSRGELVEIGGGFRVPEVLEQSGCRLVEVGTTNRTRLADYTRALRPSTAAILKVHRSNFAIVGFTSEVSISDLSGPAKEAGVPLLYDQGTGDPPVVRASVEAGADLVVFSGDKLLGGPQAGLMVGRRAFVDQARRHPLARAVRLDKGSLAALEATLGLWRMGRTEEVPAARMLAEPQESVRARAQAIGQAVGDAIGWEVVPSAAAAGGGTRPAEELPSFSVRVFCADPRRFARLLRLGEPVVVARIEDEAVWFDARTVSPGEVEALSSAIRRAAEQSGDREVNGGDRLFTGEEPVA